jgi:hypothetical protein
VLEMSTLAPIADKLSKLVRMLTSDHDGEVVAAARSIDRTLRSAGLDIHVLAAAIERGGVASATPNALGWPSVACECAARPERLRSKRERAFVADMVVWTRVRGEPTERQAKWLRSIYLRVGR